MLKFARLLLKFARLFDFSICLGGQLPPLPPPARTPMIVIAIINIVAIYGPLKSNMIILYQITQLSEQKYRLAIPFAENNFGPFVHIVFVIVLFESPSKTLSTVLFPRLYLQICIFKSIYFHFLSDCELEVS